MRFLLMMNYGYVEADVPPMPEWSPADVKGHIDFQLRLNEELTATGELVDAQGLAGPDEAKFVVADGRSAPLVTDGPFADSKTLLAAGYRIVEVDTEERAVEIAATMSAAPRPDGEPIRQLIEVRQVMSAPDPEM
ncbi:YciI family protein [soil metagenome]